jgi:hypothetical protein
MASQNAVGFAQVAILKLQWTTGSAKGFVDWLPYVCFEWEADGTVTNHDVRRGRSRATAQCKIAIAGDTVDLDYATRSCRQFNVDHDMELGVLRLHFTDSDRRHVAARQGRPFVEWKQDGASQFEDAKIQILGIEIESTDRMRLSATQSKAERALRRVLTRPGQPFFRGSLRAIYDGRCCISGCGARQALEGAHIRRYTGTSSDALTNGLLLRRDLHALFDCWLVTIEPTTRQVRIAKDVRASGGAEYSALHGRTLSGPLKKHDRYRPSNDLLKEHWNQAVATHGRSEFD